MRARTFAVLTSFLAACGGPDDSKPADPADDTAIDSRDSGGDDTSVDTPDDTGGYPTDDTATGDDTGVVDDTGTVPVDDTGSPACVPTDERCDGVDNDCDGEVDEDATDVAEAFADEDADGYGDPDAPFVGCSVPSGYVDNDLDCDDVEPLAWTGADEACDGVDNDCDGAFDEDAVDAGTWYDDADGDGYGDPDRSAEACTAAPGTVSVAEDCDDSDGQVYPGAAEVCDGLDNDCEGTTDEGASDAITLYRDADGDGYGNASRSGLGCVGTAGTVENAEDCDDTLSVVNPAADEICDSLDNDCDGTTDVGATDATTLYRDSDGDGHGDPTRFAVSCPISGAVPNPDDCDDGDALAWMGADELCDDVDNDCDGTIDEEAVDETLWAADADGDGAGDPDVTVSACDAPSGYVWDQTDCDDDNDGQPDSYGHCAADFVTSFGSTMLVINPGTFTMGGDGGDPTSAYTDHEVTLTHTFWISEHEVTQDEWAAWTSAPDRYPSMFNGYGDRPVERVTWEDAVLYLNALSAAEGLTECYAADGSDALYVAYACDGYRLPTEAEWEYAAHAGQSTSYAGSNVLDDVGWTYFNAVASTHDVCQLDRNAWGLCDMTGNVWEWVHDWFDPLSGGYLDGRAETDPTGAGSGVGRVTRGGSWGCDEVEDNLAYRGFHTQDDADNTLGFRIARTSTLP